MILFDWTFGFHTQRTKTNLTETTKIPNIALTKS